VNPHPIIEKTRGLLLVAHGCAAEPGPRTLTHTLAREIAERGVFAEVRCAFWKEPVFLRDALERFRSEEIYVVPLFLAEGYYTREVVPRELRLDGPCTMRGAQGIYYCPAVGVHPLMGELVLGQAATAALSPRERSRAVLVVVGHGTPRSRTSADTVYAVTARLRAREVFASVRCGFLDEEPRIERVVAGLEAEQVVIVPYFLAEGWHTRVTIPEALGLDGACTHSRGRTLRYTPPVGVRPELAQIVLDLAHDAGARVRRDLAAVDLAGATEARARRVSSPQNAAGVCILPHDPSLAGRRSPHTGGGEHGGDSESRRPDPVRAGWRTAHVQA
jgi:sirohydrochlorin cobaltochelatase